MKLYQHLLQICKISVILILLSGCVIHNNYRPVYNKASELNRIAGSTAMYFYLNNKIKSGEITEEIKNSIIKEILNERYSNEQ